MNNTEDILRQYAGQYETTDFLSADPSWFMHQVKGEKNQEVTAFIASCLSYGSRSQFMPKIQKLIDFAEGDLYTWTVSGNYANDIPDDPTTTFYRLYTMRTMHKMLEALQKMLVEYGSIGEYVKANANSGYAAVEALTRYFASQGVETIIPKNTSSACKRLCMFLRWMVRDNSPVDLGLWNNFIDKRTLIIPLDTHVLQEANRLGLVSSKGATMQTAIKLTRRLAEVFPDDPTKGDFALFGYGVNN